MTTACVVNSAKINRMRKLRVLLADDHDAFREAMCMFLDMQPDVEVVAQVADGTSVLREFGTSGADVVCMDIEMPGSSGIDTTRALLAQWPSARVVGLSAHADVQRAAAMLNAGALGYVLKGSPTAQLLNAIRAASRNQHYLDAALGVSSVHDLPA